MSIWLYINILLFLIVLLSIDYSFIDLPLHIILGLVGLFLVLFNWTRHAVFSTIRQTEKRSKKIRLAKISKKIYPFHRYVGTISLLFIIAHAWVIFDTYGFQPSSWKMLSGIAASFVLLTMVISGWLRLYLPSGRKRRIHLYTGFTLFFFIVIHTVLF
ncbi:hypothetical protein [Oceanobacillus sp. CAU 1775]